MNRLSPQALGKNAVRAAFVEQLNIMYNAKASFAERLPGLIDQANFYNLKHALEETLDESKQQMMSLKKIFVKMDESWENDCCLDHR